MRPLISLLAVCAATVGFAESVVWKFPLTNGCHEGLPFSDARTGVLVWGGGDELRLTVGRADLWDHRGGCAWRPEWSYSNIVALVRKGDKQGLNDLFKVTPPPGQPRNPQMLPLGRVVLRLPGAHLRTGALDPMTGLGELVLDYKGRTCRVDLAMGKKSWAFAMKLPSGLVPEVKTVPSMDHPSVRNALAPIGIEPPRTWSGPQAGGFVWRLPADEPVSLGWQFCDGTFVLATTRGAANPKTDIPFLTLRGESLDQWRNFWRGTARVSVPDAVLARLYSYGMYRFGAMTDPDGVPAGLQGAWLEDDKMIPWNGDYHFNVNVQACYAPAYRSGRLDHLKPLFRMIRSWWPRLRENARLFCGVEDGFLLPHSVDDRGTCIGGYWAGTIDHGSTAWVADMMFRYAKCSRDLDFLRTDVYPFMKGTMNVFRAMMEDVDGRLALPVGSSPEWGALDGIEVGRNPSFQLAAAHRLARNLVEAARMLGEEPEAMWLDVERRLPLYAAGEEGLMIFEGVGLKQSHRHHSHLAGLYPFDVLDTADPTVDEAVRRALFRWIEMGTGWWSGWCVPWAAILHVHAGNPDRAVDLLQAWETYFTNAGHASRHDIYRPGFSDMVRTFWDSCSGRLNNVPGQEIMQMDGACGAAAAVLELFVHDVGGRTEFFRGCPESWGNVSFSDIRLADGTVVSKTREGETPARMTEPVRAVSVPPIFKPESVVLFQGDSITHGGRLGDMNHYLGHGYQAEIAMRYLAYRPEDNLQFANRAESGHTSSNLVERWSRDAVPFTANACGEGGVFRWGTAEKTLVPDVLSILVGINDYLRKDGWQVSAADFEKNLEQMVARALKANPRMRIILCEPFRLPADDNPDFLARQAAVRRVAERNNLAFVPFQRLFSERLLRLKPYAKYWFWDAYHPTYAAHMQMADFWLETVAADFARGKGTPTDRMEDRGETGGAER